MSDKKEQVKPLAPAAHHLDIEDPDAFSTKLTAASPHRKCIKGCGCSAAIFVIISTVIIILMFTVFRVKDPSLKISSVNIQGVDMNASQAFGPGLKLVVRVDLAIKNPNVSSFKFTNTTTDLYYNGSVIGERNSLPGQVEARRTFRTNVVIEIMVDKILERPRFKNDTVVGLLPISSHTRISGKIKVTSVIKRSVVVKMNCTMNLNISSWGIQDRKCFRRVSL